MSARYDAVLVGAGHNGLVCAAYLARAGLSVLVLERRETAGGAAVTEELFPGFRFDSCAHRLGHLDQRVVRDLGLAGHGLQVRRPDLTVLAPLPGGDHLAIWRDPDKTVEEIRRHSPDDAVRWSRFGAAMAPAVRFLGHMAAATPPELPPAASRDLLAFMELGIRLRRLGRRELTEVLRVLPMSAAELLDEWFESEPLQGLLAALGVTGLFLGPRAAGTAYLLLGGLSAEAEVLRPTELVTGGMGRLTEALARSRADPHQGLDGHRRRSERRRGDRCRSDRVQRGPQAHLLRARRADGAGSRVHQEGEEGSHPGRVREGSPGVGGASPVRRHGWAPGTPRGRRPHQSQPRLSGASVRRRQVRRGLPITLPRGRYPLPDRPDPRSPGPARDVRLRPVRSLRAERGILGRPQERGAGRSRRGDALRVRAGHVYGLTGGCTSHGEMALDQLFFMRPVPECAQYRTPIRDLYLCGAGTHPGGGVSGTAGYNAAREVLRAGKRAK